jgi:hypothetical protein
MAARFALGALGCASSIARRDMGERNEKLVVSGATERMVPPSMRVTPNDGKFSRSNVGFPFYSADRRAENPNSDVDCRFAPLFKSADAIAAMDDDGERVLRRFALKWCVYLHLRSCYREIAPGPKNTMARPTNQVEVIDLVNSDDDDEDFQAQLKAAIDASKLDTQSGSSATKSSLDPPTGSRGPLSTFLSERMQMEKERLSRQKRLHPEILEDANSAHHDIATKQPRLSRTAATSSAVSTEFVFTDESQLFLHGELRQTAVQHSHPRKDGKPTFRLTDVLGKVRSAFI